MLRMRLDRFWLLNKNVDRLAAESDFRSLRVALGAASGGEGATQTFTALQKEVGQIAVYDEGRRQMALSAERDVAGLMELAGMGDLG